jgi:hypothetical protein
MGNERNPHGNGTAFDSVYHPNENVDLNFVTYR